MSFLRDGVLMTIRETPQSLTIQQALEVAVKHHEAGHLSDADGIYQKILQVDPDHSIALHLCGVIADQVGNKETAVELILKALAISPKYAVAHYSLGNVLKSLGRIDDAISHYQKAIGITPDYIDAYNNLGNTFYGLGQYNEAVFHFQTALKLNPSSATTHNNLGSALKKLGRQEEAIAHYGKAIDIDPDYADAHSNIGNILKELGQFEQAVAHCQKAVDLNPGHPEAYNNLGNALRKLGQMNEAMASYRKAIDLKPESAEALSNLGTMLRENGQPEKAIVYYLKAIDINPDYALAHTDLGHVQNELGRYSEAQAAFDKGFQLSHGGPWWNAATYADGDRSGSVDPAEIMFTSVFKLEDSIDRFDYLISKKRIDTSFQRMVESYRTVLAEIQRQENHEIVIELTRDQIARLGTSHDRAIYCLAALRIGTGTISKALAFEQIEDNYFSSPVSVTTLDAFLTPEALHGLRKFCLESTMFFDYTGDYFVEGKLSHGFSCDLLFQIAQEIKQCFPRILGDHHLSNMWVYRYNNQSKGVAAHTDEGAVTFNLWITPDDANLDPDRGGLIVYTKEQPHDWDWEFYNKMKYTRAVEEEISEFLADADALTIPHRENRAMLFHSNLFHKSDQIRFKDGYENRRMNITFLFGRRER